MRILYFHQHFTTPKFGGGVRSYKFAKKLIEKGHEVTMVCGERSNFNFKSNDSDTISRGRIEGIDIIQIKLPYSNKHSLFKRAIVFLKFAILGIKVAKKEEYDLLFASSTPLTAGLPGIYMKMFSKKRFKFIFEVRDLWPELPKALGLKNPIFLYGMKLLEKYSYKYADACIGLSPGICDGINRITKNSNNIKMIPNGCDMDIFGESMLIKPIEIKGVEKDDKVAIFPGAHGIANGLESIVDVAEEVQNRGRNDIKFLFVGDGKMKNSIIQSTKMKKLRNCIFLSPVSKDKLAQYMNRADVGLMTLKNIPAFYYGTSPNKFFDYISAGLPVINNYPGWLADLITENECGIAIPPENPSIFADAILKITDSKDLCHKYGENAKNLASKQFDREILAENFVKFIER